jgi:hypothetical protein
VEEDVKVGKVVAVDMKLEGVREDYGLDLEGVMEVRVQRMSARAVELAVVED